MEILQSIGRFIQDQILGMHWLDTGIAGTLSSIPLFIGFISIIIVGYFFNVIQNILI